MTTTTRDATSMGTDAQMIASMREYMDSTADGEGKAFLEQTMDQLSANIGVLEQSGGDFYASTVANTKQVIQDIKTALTQSASTLKEQDGAIQTGRYTISAGSTMDGSLSIVDNQTSKSVTVWGDPHIMVNGRTIADFQAQGLNLELADGTLVHIDPTALKNGVSHIADVTVQKGKQQATFAGIDGTFQNGATLKPMVNTVMTQALVNDWSTCPTLSFGDNGKLSTTNKDGTAKAVLTAQANGAQTNVDKMGGGFVY